MPFQFALLRDYAQKLPPMFYRKQRPFVPPESRLRLFNDALAESLGMDAAALRAKPAWFSGAEVPPGAEPIAQAYSGHQFGHFTRLGDGRAVLLGEWQTKDRRLWDIQLKGSGRTPYSRGGDGKATLGPMLREYLISEAMAGLRIPTTRGLAVAETGETVQREEMLPGAVLTRVAQSHIRVGTFEYAAEVGGTEAVLALHRYAADRHDPQLRDSEKPLLSFLRAVGRRQARLIAEWMRVGFVHGVMNTDNMAVSGETIDYGPCAFMDRYDPATVFSSIDWQRRYAFGRQPIIAQWNVARLAEALLKAVHETGEGDLSDAQEAVEAFAEDYRAAYREAMAAKLGIGAPNHEDDALIEGFLKILLDTQYDYTNGFAALTRGEEPDEWIRHPEYAQWKRTRNERLELQHEPLETVGDRMRAANPAIIPRNHVVERALDAAVRKDDWKEIRALIESFTDPYNYDKDWDSSLTEPMPEQQRRGYRTFCGT